MLSHIRNLILSLLISLPVLASEQDPSFDLVKKMTPADSELLRLIDEGNLDACAWAGTCYAKGHGCSVDFMKAHSLLAKAAKDGGAVHKRIYGAYLLSRESHGSSFTYLFVKFLSNFCCDLLNYKDGVCLLTEAAKDGDAVAMIQLAKAYDNNTGVRRMSVEDRFEKSLKWRMRACETKDPIAFKSISTWGAEIHKSKDERVVLLISKLDQLFKLFLNLAKDESPDAMLNLGIWQIYWQREAADEQQKQDTLSWLKLAHDRGLNDAGFWLAHCYRVGYGCEKSLKNKHKALKLLLHAYNRGNDASLARNIGILYTELKEWKAALRYFELAKEAYPLSQLIGNCYLHLKLYEEALTHFKTAQSQGEDVTKDLLDYVAAQAYKQLLKKQGTKKENRKNNNIRLGGDLLQIASNCDHIKAKIKQLSETLSDPKYKDYLEKLNFSLQEQLELLEKKQALITKHPRGADSTKKALSSLKALEKNLNELKGRCIEVIQGFETQQKVEQFTRTLLPIDRRDITELESTEDQRKARKELQEQSRLVLKSLQERKHKHKTRKHGPQTEKARREKAAARMEQLYVEVDTSPKPFTQMQEPEIRTQASLDDTVVTHYMEIYNVIKSSKSMEDAISSLGKLPWKIKATEVSTDYAQTPYADIAYEFRLNDQFRAVVAFTRDTSRNTNGQNNNNEEKPVGSYSLYGNRIYVDDLHIRK